MIDRSSLYAYLATLATIITLAIAGAVAASKGNDASVYLAAITGLIGVLGTFRPRSSGQSVGPNETVNGETTP